LGKECSRHREQREEQKGKSKVGLPKSQCGWSKNKEKKSKRQGLRKIACSPSYADYRPKTNAVILLHMGHTLRGEHAQEK
jgi:hypothetical protein